MQVSGFRIYFLEPGYFFSKILSEFRKKIVALQSEKDLERVAPAVIEKKLEGLLREAFNV